MSTPLLLHDSVRHGARLYPSRVAITDGSSSVTYAQLEDRARRTAALLRGPFGLRPGRRFGLLTHNRVEMAEVFVGAAMSGCACVPVNFRLAPHEVAGVLADAEASVVLVEPELESLLGEADAHVVRFGVEYEGLLAGARPVEPERPDAAEIVLQMYTSGTTGAPKGAMLSHRNLVANSWTNLAERNVVEGDTYLVTTPLCQVGGVSRLLTSIHAAATVQTRPRFDAEEVLRLIERGDVTTAFLVPTMIAAVLEAAGSRSLEVPRFRRLCYGGSPIGRELLGDAMARLRCEFQQGYGLTESSPNLTTLRPEDHVVDGAIEVVARLGSVGRESLGVDVRVVDPSGAEVASGERGEIVARGANIMEGYWRRPDATAAAVRDGWLHTGDIAVMDAERYIFIVDRMSDMLITGGMNVYPREIEVVLDADADVVESAVLGVPDARWGETPVAFVVVREGADSNAVRRRLEESCARSLARYKAPSDYRFVTTLPRNAMGKVLKRELRGR